MPEPAVLAQPDTEVREPAHISEDQVSGSDTVLGTHTVPYTTSSGTDKEAAGPAIGSGWTAAGLTRGMSALRPGDGMTGAISSAVMAASRDRAQQQPGCVGRPTCSSGPPACSSGVRFGDFSPVLVSEGGLEPPRRWYITESVIYHQSKLTQQGRSPRHFASQETIMAGNQSGRRITRLRHDHDAGRIRHPCLARHRNQSRAAEPRVRLRACQALA